MFLIKSYFGNFYGLIGTLGGSAAALPIGNGNIRLFYNLLHKGIPLPARWAFTKPFGGFEPAALAEIGNLCFSQGFDVQICGYANVQNFWNSLAIIAKNIRNWIC